MVVEGGEGGSLYLDLVPWLFLAGLPGDTEEQVDAEVHRVPVGDALTPKQHKLARARGPLVLET